MLCSWLFLVWGPTARVLAMTPSGNHTHYLSRHAKQGIDRMRRSCIGLAACSGPYLPQLHGYLGALQRQGGDLDHLNSRYPLKVLWSPPGDSVMHAIRRAIPDSLPDSHVAHPSATPCR
ncbi:hypothetical protein B0T25DRAFT_290849 [Lasiosphaeria hispida]|uniref:Secreted protein n=1 Tax=Lasiosphaeria hispida TaxID=260671 RepID=A0AAJ0MB34_9PEZI|nr:hypothetical protein B0T25DRAFT_290849 [Lasiosphaeria hispida]